MSDQALLELVAVSDFPGTGPSTAYVVRAHTTGRVSRPAEAGSAESLLAVSVGAGGYEVLCAFPAVPFAGSTRAGGWACALGLVGKMTGCAAIVYSTVEQRESGRVAVTTRLKALGVVGRRRPPPLRPPLVAGGELTDGAGVYVSTLRDMTVDGDLMAAMQGQAVPRHCVRVSREADCVLEVDVDAAWREMGLGGGGAADEVEVHVYFDA